ncbi:F-box protein At1g78100 [Brassica rapa]|uniref:F-box domain-containing protein n=1 Tax=Brassica campestris TaxID=3711 RepID=M4DGK5_BRACM|nr:F-box protein At1g78100 [Brassica rapa]XP_013695925.2 F-box protein AUF1 [Brassica napus]
MDAFDAIPNHVVIDILNKVADVKTLIRCRSVSKRFNSLAAQSDSLLLQLDQILGAAEPEPEVNSPVASFFRSIFKSILPIFSRSAKPAETPKSPAQILAGFNRIRNLDVELYGGDANLEKGAAVKWKAEFGETLKSSVIVAFRSATVNASATESPVNAVETDSEFVCGLKTRVVWTINALMAASTRHHLMGDLVKEHKEMERLTVRDRDEEGTVVMSAAGMKEYREAEARVDEKGLGVERVRDRTEVPNVRMSMRHAPMLKLKSGICLEAATLVVVRPSGVSSDDNDAELATEAFAADCMYGEAVTALLKRRRNVLEMNSF